LLYLRLLLGLGGENAYSRPLSVEEILVVTFTEAKHFRRPIPTADEDRANQW
jgi:hypothetical protein